MSRGTPNYLILSLIDHMWTTQGDPRELYFTLRAVLQKDSSVVRVPGARFTVLQELFISYGNARRNLLDTDTRIFNNTLLLLLQAGADPNEIIPNKPKMQPLAHAVRKNLPEAVDMLLAYGAKALRSK